MKRTLFFALAASALPCALNAQTPDPAIERAVLAAPARMRAAATVIRLQPDGTIAVLRQGANGLMCWDNAGRHGYSSPVDVECTTEANRPRLEQNHEFQSAGGSAEEIKARFDEAEADKTRTLSQYGSIYYRIRGTSLETAATHTTVAVPYATATSIGLPDKSGPALLWLMEPGTSSAHPMVSGR